MKLVVKDLKYEICNKEILKGINLQIKNKSFVGLIGPNGCGKTTLLKTIYRYITPKDGSVYIDGLNIYGLKNKELAKMLSVVMQENTMEFDFSVREIVEMGRFTHKSRFSSSVKDDEKFVHDALVKVGLHNHQERSFLSLSGGEKQRVMIALALCQDTDFIILDEPTNHLDIKYQLEVMKMLTQIDKTVFTTIHDMNIASTYCDYIYVMKNGNIVKQGKVNEVFTKNMFKDVFDVNAHIYLNPTNEKLNVSYVG